MDEAATNCVGVAAHVLIREKRVRAHTTGHIHWHSSRQIFHHDWRLPVCLPFLILYKIGEALLRVQLLKCLLNVHGLLTLLLD